MNFLETVIIRKLWNIHNIELKLNPNVNFLIGPNGSGKTTIINLIVAAMTADFQSLIQIPFHSIEIRMAEFNGRKKPAIRVVKKWSQDRSSFSIQYKLREAASANWQNYSLEDIEELYRYRYLTRKRRQYMESTPEVASLKERLTEFYKLSWLSIHRSKSFRKQEEEDTYDSTVDNKLMDLANEFVRYFSTLSQSASNELQKFQEAVFLSLLKQQSNDVLRTTLLSMDIEAEKSYLIDIYKELNVAPELFKELVENHFSQLEQAYINIEGSAGGPWNANDFALLITNQRVHHIVKEWNNLTTKQESIYEPKHTFLSIVNQLMPPKEFHLNNKNELCVKMESGQNLRLTNLSSGEKQMLIILGEALLQQSAASIYIADEPELSLHVEWQQALINNLRSINSNAQILFATHSPDIVSEYGNYVQHVKELIN